MLCRFFHTLSEAALSHLSRKIFAAFLFAFLLALPVHARAQSNYGAVRGMVTDAQGATLPTHGDADLRSNQDRSYNHSQRSRRVCVQRSGARQVHGDRNVSGFKLVENTGVTVDSGNTIPLDLKLQLGAQHETVEVSAAEALVDNGTSYNGQLIDSQKLQNLPNPGRNPFLFSKLDNNVTAVGDPRFVRFQDQSGSSTISIAGAPMSSNNYLVDGVPITDFSNRAVIIPSIEAVEEVKVQANTYDAEMGRTSGGLFNTTLRSGSQHAARRAAGRDAPDQLGREYVLQQPQQCTVQGWRTRNARAARRSFTPMWAAFPVRFRCRGFLAASDKTVLCDHGRGLPPALAVCQQRPSSSCPRVLQRSGDFSEIGTVTSVGNLALPPALRYGSNGVNHVCIADLSKTVVAGQAVAIYYAGNKITNINPIGQAMINTYPCRTQR